MSEFKCIEDLFLRVSGGLCTFVGFNPLYYLKTAKHMIALYFFIGALGVMALVIALTAKSAKGHLQEPE